MWLILTFCAAFSKGLVLSVVKKTRFSSEFDIATNIKTRRKIGIPNNIQTLKEGKETKVETEGHKGGHKYFIKLPQHMEASRGGNKEIKLAVFTNPSTSSWKAGRTK